MIGFNIADVTAISLGSIEISSIYAGNSVIWEDNPDYEQRYFTTVAKGSGNIGFSISAEIPTSTLTSISYSTDNGSTWTTTNNVDSQAVTITVPVNNGDKVLWKGIGTQLSGSYSRVERYTTFTSTVNFDVQGNIMSLLNGDNFYQSSLNSSSAYNFTSLFQNNTNIVNASNLILTKNRLRGYKNMFNGCTSLTTAPKILSNTTTQECYSGMFSGCTSLTTAPELPANGYLAESCYSSMFSGCTSLTTAPELPATNLGNSCYKDMFSGCTSLTTAPELPATTLQYYCYQNMFNGCSSLNYIKMLGTNTSQIGSLSNWVTGVAATGTFVKDANTTIPTGDSGIPSGWTVENYNKYEHQYLTTVAKGSGNIGFTIPSGVTTSNLTSISYSTDNGSTWTTTNNVDSQEVTVTVPVNNGSKVLWKGVGTSFYYNWQYKAKFTSTVSFDVEGNIMSLLNGDNFYQSSFASGSSNNFSNLFDSSRVVDASNLILPATTLADGCYNSMFYFCTSLTTAPELPATTLAQSCYGSMFTSCTSLTTAPELPATTLAQSCYGSMFYFCTSLTTAPELPATTLVDYCYNNMFGSCSNLNYIKMLATDISASGCLNSWVSGVAATGTFVKDASATIPTGTSGIPSGWTVENIGADYEQQYFTTIAKGLGDIVFNIPLGVSTSNLTSISYSTDNGSTWTTTNNVDNQEVTVTVHANNGDKVLWKGVGTTMYADSDNYVKIESTTNFDVEGNIMSLLNGDNFYQSSFASGSSYNFSNLFNAANVVDASNLILPATTLTEYCYGFMFMGCTSLTTAPELPATTLAQLCYNFMFYGCTSLTTAPELPATSLAMGCYQSMFRDCTSLTTAPELPATTLTMQCYDNMFNGCSNLNYIKMLATNTSASDCLWYWVHGVAATGTFVKNASMTTLPTGNSGIPSGWTVQDAA